MEDIYKEAEKRVEKKKKYRKHVITFVFSSIIMLIINIFVTRGFPWALFAIGFWGVGIASKGVEIYGLFGNNDEELEKEIEKLKRLREKSKMEDELEEDENIDLEDLQNKHKQEKEKRGNWDEKDFV